MTRWEFFTGQNVSSPMVERAKATYKRFGAESQRLPVADALFRLKVVSMCVAGCYGQSGALKKEEMV